MIKVVHVISGVRRGGAEHCLLRLVERMDRRRFSSSIISILPLGPLADQMKSAQVQIESLDCEGASGLPRALWRLTQKLNAVQPDIVQTWLYHADVLGTLASSLSRSRHRLIWNIRNSDLSPERRASWRMLTSVLAMLSRQPHCVVANSKAGIDAHLRLGYQPQRWIHIPNGWVVQEEQNKNKVRRRLGLPAPDVLIGMVARLAKQKDFQTFLSAVRLLGRRSPNLKFVLLGHRVTRQTLASGGALPDEVLQRLIFLGEHANLDEVWPALDAVTLTSAYGEGTPNCLGEAMAAGLPIIATDVGDTRVLVPNGNWIVPPRSPRALAGAWSVMADVDSAALRVLGDANRNWVRERYQIDRMVRAYEDLFTQVGSGNEANADLPYGLRNMNLEPVAFAGSLRSALALLPRDNTAPAE